jgi:PAS domain-containing protein
MTNKEENLSDAQLLRLKAEEKLKKNNKKAGTGINESDTKKLLHELQVHQIELEMQNEELQEAYYTVEKALEKYTMLYDFAPAGYFTLDKDSMICDVNFTGAEMLGERRFALSGANFRLFVSEDSKSAFDKFFKEVYAGNGKESCALKLGSDGETLSLYYAEGVVTGDDRKCLLALVDIAGLKSRIDI